MHPVAVKCIKWAVGLSLVGVVAITFGPEAFVRIAEYSGKNGEAGIWLLNVLIMLLKLTTLPLAGSLVGAAVVIQTLAPHVRAIDEDDDFADHSTERDALPPSIEA